MMSGLLSKVKSTIYSNDDEIFKMGITMAKSLPEKYQIFIIRYMWSRRYSQRVRIGMDQIGSRVKFAYDTFHEAIMDINLTKNGIKRDNKTITGFWNSGESRIGSNFDDKY